MKHEIDPITFDVLALLDNGDTFTPYQLSRRIPGWLDIANMSAIRRHLATIPTVCVAQEAQGRLAERWGSTRHHKPFSLEVKPKGKTGDPGRWARCKAVQDRVYALLAQHPEGLTIGDVARALSSITPDKADTTVRALHRDSRAHKVSGHDSAGRREVKWFAIPVMAVA